MHIYPSWVASCTCTKWPHWHQYLGHRSGHKISKVKVMAPRSKVTGPKVHAYAHLPLMSSCHTQTDHIGINTLDTGVSTRFPRSRSWLQGQRSQDKNFHAHAHLPLMGSPHAQTGHTGINTLDTGVSTGFPRSRSWLQGLRSQDQNCTLMHIYPSWVTLVPIHN